MKLFACKNQHQYGGGCILVAANNKTEAYLTAANKFELPFFWKDNNPDGKVEHCESDTYPYDSWFEVEHLSADVSTPQIIFEDHYTE